MVTNEILSNMINIISIIKIVYGNAIHTIQAQLVKM